MTLAQLALHLGICSNGLDTTCQLNQDKTLLCFFCNTSSKRAPSSLIVFFHFRTEQGWGQLKKSPCIYKKRKSQFRGEGGKQEEGAKEEKGKNQENRIVNNVWKNTQKSHDTGNHLPTMSRLAVICATKKTYYCSSRTSYSSVIINVAAWL